MQEIDEQEKVRMTAKFESTLWLMVESIRAWEEEEERRRIEGSEKESDEETPQP
jgi:hypothetical protein